MTGEPSAWAMEQAGRTIGHTVSCMMQDGECSCFLLSRCTALARCFDAAELRGHTRAVQETAIASIHKAVAAERAAIVRRLREWASVGRVATADDYADEIERGDHHKEQA